MGTEDLNKIICDSDLAKTIKPNIRFEQCLNMNILGGLLTMNKIEIKLKKCCFDCENFDVSGIQGFQSYYACYSAGIERVIACGHYKVCKRYIEDAPLKKGKIDGVKNANHKKR